MKIITSNSKKASNDKIGVFLCKNQYKGEQYL